MHSMHVSAPALHNVHGVHGAIPVAANRQCHRNGMGGAQIYLWQFITSAVYKGQLNRNPDHCCLQSLTLHPMFGDLGTP